MPTLIEDTIAAISTPPGRGGIGVIRLSGPHAKLIAQKILPPQKTLQNRFPLYSALVDPETKKEFDSAVMTLFAAPHSYTREDVVEISCHGSPVLLQAILHCLLSLGARLACAGEFTLRAFLRGRIDLVQAEAIRDLIEAKTLVQAHIAHQQAMGGLSKRIGPLKKKLVDLISRLEAGIDFAEDDVEIMPDREIESSLGEIIAGLQQMEKRFDLGKLLSEGVSIAILGRPNVGKSSLFNALLVQDRAIVTEFAGTTRDVIAETFQIQGIPIRLLDTAGIRDGVDMVERIGVDKTLEALAEADILLLVVDGSFDFQADDLRIMEKLGDRPFHLAINKADLPHVWKLENYPANTRSVMWVSALSGEGLEELKAQLLPELHSGLTIEEEGLMTNLRQQQNVKQALDCMRNIKHNIVCNNIHEIFLIDLYAALKALNVLTGETTVEDILDNIFGKFCVGK